VIKLVVTHAQDHHFSNTSKFGAILEHYQIVSLGAFTSTAFAEPLVLSAVQMDTVTAGQISQSNTSTVDVMQSNSASGVTEAIQSNDSSVTVSQSNVINPPPANGG
jgi:hypothetical protein